MRTWPMRAARCSLPRTTLIALALVSWSGLTTAAGSQVQPQGPAASAPAGMLALTSPSQAAKDELRAAIADYYGWNWKSGADHAARALALDSSVALARVWVAAFTMGPTAGAEMQRAATDASRVPDVEEHQAGGR